MGSASRISLIMLKLFKLISVLYPRIRNTFEEYLATRELGAIFIRNNIPEIEDFVVMYKFRKERKYREVVIIQNFNN